MKKREDNEGGRIIGRKKGEKGRRKMKKGVDEKAGTGQGK